MGSGAREETKKEETFSLSKMKKPDEILGVKGGRKIIKIEYSGSIGFRKNVIKTIEKLE